jgi:hypothetical protein
MHPSNVKVLYIDGQGRSGRTLLHNVLGQVEGFFAAGDLREIWKRILPNISYLALDPALRIPQAVRTHDLSLFGRSDAHATPFRDMPGTLRKAAGDRPALSVV